MSSHDKLSPSAGHRWSVCTKSPEEEAKYPDNNKSGPAAIDGTHTHTLLEGCLNNEVKDTSKMVGIKLSDHEGTFIVDEGRAARVQKALNYIYSRADEMKPCAIRAESRVNPELIIGVANTSGTADCILTGGSEIEVVDYKDGMRPVSAKDNVQMELYALGSLAEYRKDDGTFPFETVTMTIIQPKLELKGAEAISSYTVTVDELLAKAFTYTMAGAAISTGQGVLVPGESQCMYCKAKGNCKAYAEFTASATSLDLDDMVQTAADADPNAMSDERLREIIDAKPLLTSLISSAEEEALRRLEAGHSIPGIKLVNGPSQRSWALDDDEIIKRLKSMGVPKDSMYITKVVSPAQVKKLKFKKKVKGEEVVKSLSERQLKTLDAEYVSVKPGRHLVVPESDSRKSIQTEIADMFQPVNQPVEVIIEPVGLPGWMK